MKGNGKFRNRIQRLEDGLTQLFIPQKAGENRQLTILEYTLFDLWAERIWRAAKFAHTPWAEMSSDLIREIWETVFILDRFLGEKYGMNLWRPDLKRDDEPESHYYWSDPDVVPILADQGFPDDERLRDFWRRFNAFQFMKTPEVFDGLVSDDQKAELEAIILDNYYFQDWRST